MPITVGRVSKPDDPNRRIGLAIARFRMAREMSQKSLALAMKERGWRWSQPTLASIEQGERPLKLDEADALVELLGLRDVTDLTSNSDEHLAQMRLEQLDRATRQLEEAAAHYLRTQFSLAYTLDEVAAQGGTLPGTHEDVVGRLSTTPEQVAARAAMPEGIQSRLDRAGKQFLDQGGRWNDYGEFSNDARFLKILRDSNPAVHGEHVDLDPARWRDRPK